MAAVMTFPSMVCRSLYTFENILSFSHIEAQLIYKCLAFLVKHAAKSLQMHQPVDFLLQLCFLTADQQFGQNISSFSLNIKL